MPLSGLFSLPDWLNSDVRVVLYPEIQSTHKNHRNLLRQRAKKDLVNCGIPLDGLYGFEDLSTLPKLKQGSISLSHSPLGSAMIHSSSHRSVGIDVEVKNRIHPKLLARVSLESELNSAPQGFDLFTAKEAAWKALNSFENLPTLSHIETCKWSQFAPEQFQYYVKKPVEGLPGWGIGIELTEVYLSFFMNP